MSSNDNDAIPDTNDVVVVQDSTSFNMTLDNVQDDIVLEDTQINDMVLQQVTTDDAVDVTVINEGLDQEEVEIDDNSSDALEVEKPFTLVDNNFDASSRAIPDTTQNIVILTDDEFDEVV
ncbi:hypothetical protein TSUD_265220 [Trifolium subterraneum]|uniref:Uncharacterized protein n=1 Tax=Trifolium subterraneum TaxID=3900 RepID=A0A2Z6N674_TRISU|nr:hypothetical protein TSUD_265220 [Trifolium subterraneum]